MNRFLSLTATLFALSTAPAFSHDGVHIVDAYVRTIGTIGASGAVYFTIQNHADVDDRLLSATSDAAKKLMLHTNVETDGIMSMPAMSEGLPIVAYDEHVLARGGDHLMLMGLTRALKDGDSIRVTLTFEHAGVVTIDVPVDNGRDNARKETLPGHVHGSTAPAPSN